MILDSEARIAEYTAGGWWGSQTIADVFIELVRRHPAAVAVVDPPNRRAFTNGEPQRLTYAELRQRVDALAGGLLELGVVDRVQDPLEEWPRREAELDQVVPRDEGLRGETALGEMDDVAADR